LFFAWGGEGGGGGARKRTCAGRCQKQILSRHEHKHGGSNLEVTSQGAGGCQYEVFCVTVLLRCVQVSTRLAAVVRVEEGSLLHYFASKTGLFP
jgi:hypothetical protein